MNKNRKSTSGLMIIALLGLIIMAFILFSTGGDTQTMKYSEVIDYFEQGKVSEFVLNMKNGAMQLTLTEEATQELLEQQPGMTLGGQQTGALGGLWGGSSSGAASDTANRLCSPIRCRMRANCWTRIICSATARSMPKRMAVRN